MWDINGRINVKKVTERRIAEGHQWVFSNEITGVTGLPRRGGLVEVCRENGKAVGLAFYNPNSLIAARMILLEPGKIGPDLFAARIEEALSLRRKVYPELQSFRVVFGESDFLPGLVVDKFGDALVVQAYCAGMDMRLGPICDVLEVMFSPTVNIERNEAFVRGLEGLELRKGVLRGRNPKTVEIEEGGLTYQIDLLGGQKTGFFFDQRESRLALRRYVAGASVLDCYCGDGPFALSALSAGAKSVLGLDGSEEAVLRARRNARHNRLKSKSAFECGNLPAALNRLVKSGESFDTVILDPPSFARSKKNLPIAVKGYEKINAAAMKVIEQGGLLATFSCSHHIRDETFMLILQEAGRKAGRSVRILEWRTQAPDHPILPSMPESKYLKGAFCQIL